MKPLQLSFYVIASFHVFSQFCELLQYTFNYLLKRICLSFDSHDMPFQIDILFLHEYNIELQIKATS